MKLLYDLYYAQPLGGSKFHGGGEYMKTIFKYLAQYYSKHISIEVFYNPSMFIDEWLIKLIGEYKIKSHYVENNSDINYLLENQEFEVFYTGMPYQYEGIIFPENIRTVATIHGLRVAEKPVDTYTYLYQSGKEKYKSLIKRCIPSVFSTRAAKNYQSFLRKFDVIATDSEHSFYAIKIWLSPEENKTIKVFYVPEKYKQGIEVTDEQKTEIVSLGKYLLILGGNRWEKNGIRAIMALEDLFSIGKLMDYRVVICGTVPYKVKKKIRYINRYSFYEYVKPEFLEALYSDCDIFLYPTLNEGFGMPPLEAMKYGKTCIVSGVCSLPEVCGDAVYYVNPYDIKEIENRILHAADMKINKEKIKTQFTEISSRQDRDLKGLCEFIINGGLS